MKLIVTLLVAVALSFSLAACATKATKTAKVKCPACGFEFEAPMD